MCCPLGWCNLCTVYTCNFKSARNIHFIPYFLSLSKKTHLKSDSWCCLSNIPLNGESVLNPAVAIFLLFFSEEETNVILSRLKFFVHFQMDIWQTGVSRVGGTCYSYCYGWIGDWIPRELCFCVLFLTYGLLAATRVLPKKLAHCGCLWIWIWLVTYVGG